MLSRCFPVLPLALATGSIRRGACCMGRCYISANCTGECYISCSGICRRHGGVLRPVRPPLRGGPDLSGHVRAELQRPPRSGEGGFGCVPACRGHVAPAHGCNQRARPPCPGVGASLCPGASRTAPRLYSISPDGRLGRLSRAAVSASVLLMGSGGSQNVAGAPRGVCEMLRFEGPFRGPGLRYCRGLPQLICGVGSALDDDKGHVRVSQVLCCHSDRAGPWSRLGPCPCLPWAGSSLCLLHMPL